MGLANAGATRANDKAKTIKPILKLAFKQITSTFSAVKT